MLTTMAKSGSTATKAKQKGRQMLGAGKADSETYQDVRRGERRGPATTQVPPFRKLYIGTSGWMYKDWGSMFYPPDMKKGHLQFLAKEFHTVEINSSFYHLPLHSTFEKWRDETPGDFVFAVKMSRYITYRKAHGCH
jgi:hypothetical protein